jgi:hypothetical protein
MPGPAGDENGRRRSQKPKIPNEPNFTDQPKENKADIGLPREPNLSAARQPLLAQVNPISL